MTQPLSHKFIAELEPPRDRLYAAALAKSKGDARAAEELLQSTSRALFGQFARYAVSDVPAAMMRSIGPEPAAAPENAAVATADAAMPADVWARLAASVQWEAAQSSNAKALSPDSVLLKPDPLLAPKKSTPRKNDENFDLASPSRMIVMGGVLLLIALVVTIYIVTRPASPHSATRPASDSARTLPAAPSTMPAATLSGGAP